MDRHTLLTPPGELWLWGEADALENPKPLVLFINGAFAIERPRSFELQDLMPEAAVLAAHLPGNHCPSWGSHTIETYAAGYSAALDQIGKPAVVIGGSIGALVALSITSLLARGLVLIEPPLVTEKLWCLLPSLRKMLLKAPADEDLRAFIWNMFGVNETTVDPRDYRPLVQQLTRPSRAMFGEAALMPQRNFTELPSLVDAPERELLAQHPLVKARVVPVVGHNVPGRGMEFVRTEVRELLRELQLTAH